MANRGDKLKRKVRKARERFRNAKRVVPRLVEKITELGGSKKVLRRARSGVKRVRRYWRDILRNRVERLKRWREEHPQGFQPFMLNGHPGNIADSLKPEIYRAWSHGLYVTSTTDGGHAATSWHYPWNNPDGLGHAFDCAGAYSQMVAYQQQAGQNPQRYKELFGPDDWYVKNGTRYTGQFPAHEDHVHVAR